LFEAKTSRAPVAAEINPVLPATDSLKCYLVVVEGANLGAEHLLLKPDTVVGRTCESDILIDDDKVSRRHLQISLLTGGEGQRFQAKVIDLNSTNGVMVNGRRVKEAGIASGDRIRLGNTVIKFEARARSEVDYNERLYQQAVTDQLTGLFNKVAFYKELQQFASIAVRYHRCFSVMIIDLDNFKQINETFGAPIGDNVLKMIGFAFVNLLREQDIIGRLQDNQFAALLPETSIKEAILAAERMRAVIERTRFTSVGCTSHITASIGLAEFPAATKDLERLIIMARQAMQQAKKEGGNQVKTLDMITH